MNSERDRTLVLLLAWTGLRFGEAIALRRADVLLPRPRLSVSRSVSEVAGTRYIKGTKTHETRKVAMPPFVSGIVASYMRDLVGGRDSLLFPDANGGPIRTHWKRRYFDPAARRAGLMPPTSECMISATLRRASGSSRART